MSFWLASGSIRVRRGGSWRGVPRRVRADNRSCDAPGYRYNNLGLRLVRRVS